MIYTIKSLPIVDPLMVRRISPIKDGWASFRDKVLILNDSELEVEEIGLAESRLPFDADVVDQSGATLEITTGLMINKNTELVIIGLFTSRRWRNHRNVKPDIDGANVKLPTGEEPLLFIGNPYIISRSGSASEIEVHSDSSYLIKSGCRMEMEAA